MKQILIPFLLKLEGVGARVEEDDGGKGCSELAELLDSARPKPTVPQLFQALQHLREGMLLNGPKNALLSDIEQPRAKEVFAMFRRLCLELLSGLKLARNNELAKWLCFEVFRKYDELFRFVCAKNKMEANLSDARCVEKAVTALLDDA